MKNMYNRENSLIQIYTSIPNLLNIVKPVHVVPCIKQPPVLKGHLLVLS